MSMWSKLVDQVVFFGLLQLIIRDVAIGLRLLTAVILIISLIWTLYRHSRGLDPKKQLQELSRLLALIESGNSPRYSLEQIHMTDYPDYMTHPADEFFSPLIFKRQLELFEKNILLQNELEAEFAIVKYRMRLMKFLPLLLMIGLQRLMPMEPSTGVQRVIVLGFIISYQLAQYLERLC